MTRFALETPAIPKGAMKPSSDAPGILHGTQVCKLGPATGHGVIIDDDTLDQIVALGNGAPDGIKSRFGHPNLCSEALGTFCGVRRNFRRAGDYVVADIHFSEAANPAMLEHIQRMATDHPTMLGSSMVVSADLVEREGFDDDGAPLLPVLRVDALHAVDLVDEPASGDGLFAEPIEGLQFSADLMVGLRKALQNPDFVERAQVALSHQAKVLGLASGPRHKPVGGDVQTAVMEERSRIAKMLSRCKPHHFQATQKHPNGFAFHAIDSGMEYEEFLEGLIELNAKNDALVALEEASDAIRIGSAEPGEFSGRAPDAGNLEQILFERFRKHGFSEEEARTMAESATMKGL